MFKRFLSITLVLAMIVAVFTVIPVTAAETDSEEVVSDAIVFTGDPGDDPTEEPTQAVISDEEQIELNGGLLKYRVNQEAGTVSITGAEDLSDEVVIPSEIDGYPVVAIEEYALLGQDAVASVTVPDSVVTIGAEALGYNEAHEKRNGFVIIASERSCAADYADENGFDFVDINADNYPHITSFENTENGTKIKWSAFDGADSYGVYYLNDNGSWKRLATVAQCEYVDKTAVGGEERVYTVRALNNGEYASDYSDRGWKHVFIAAPTVTLSNHENGVKIKWTASAGAEKYRVYYYGRNGWTKLTETADTYFIDTDVTSGNNYTYTVRCISADGQTFTSDYRAGKKIRYVAAPRISSFENTANGVKIKWNAVKGADFYRLYFKKKPTDSWTRLASKYLTEYEDTSVKPGETRYYTLRCLNEKDEFVSDYVGNGWSNTFVAAPTVTLSNHENGVQIKWTASAGAEKYRVYYYGSKGWIKLTDTTNTSYVDTDVKSGSNYTYTVRCISPDGKKFTSVYKAGKKIRYVAAPRFTSIENDTNGVKLKWNAVKGASFYRIYYKNKQSDSWTRLASKYLTEYVDTSVKNGATRYYTIRCLNDKEEFVSDFVGSGWSNIFHAPPAITSVSEKDGGNLVKWDAGTGDVAAYRLYRKPLGGSWSRLFDSVTTTSYTDTSVTKDKIYAYTLRYLNENGKLISENTDNVRYYKNGVKLNGKVESGGGTYYFDDGYLRSGLVRINGKLYYYNSNGKLVKDTIVKSGSDYYYADKNGVCCESEEIRLAAEFMAKYCKGSTLKEKMKYGFMYLANNFPYQRYYDPPTKASDMPHLAISSFKNRNANCYRYAADFCCLARMAGYRARVAVGTTGGLPHGWTEVYVDGRWLICDVDANLPQYHTGAYGAYMMTSHFWQLSKSFSAELTIENGKAVWK